VPVINAGIHFAQNLEIRLHPGQPGSGPARSQASQESCQPGVMPARYY
jgi:hypothetical protein